MSILSDNSIDFNAIENFSIQLELLKQSAQQLQLLLSEVTINIVQQKRNFLNSEQASQYLGISINTLRAYSSKNYLPYFKLGKMSYFLVDDLNSFVINKANRVKSISEIQSDAITMAHTSLSFQTNKKFKNNSKGISK
jgi:hypothetical protein